MLATAIDALLEKNVLKALDLLCQQFKAVELAQQDGSWRGARHLNPLADASDTALSPGERSRLYAAEMKEVKDQKVIQDYGGRTGGQRSDKR